MLFVLVYLFGGYPSHYGIVSHVFQHNGAKTGKTSAAYRDLLFDAYVGCKIALWLKNGTAADDGSDGNHATFANAAIMANLYQVVNLHIILNDGAAKGGTFDGSVAANEDVVAYDNIAKVWEMHWLTLIIPFKAKTFLSQDSSRLYLAIAAKHNMVVKHNVGM